jgi:hypothetical protein
VEATVYWSVPTSLMTPSMWKKIDTVTLAEVPRGNTLVVSDAIPWVPPGTGHYCFVVVLNSPLDPQTDPTTFSSFDEFMKYVRLHNNVTWRNFNVQELLTVESPEEAIEEWLAFGFPGAFDRDRPMGLVIEWDDPRRVQVLLEAQRGFRAAFAPSVPFLSPNGGGRWLIPLSSSGQHHFAERMIPKEWAQTLRLLVRVRGNPTSRRGIDIRARQFHRGQEVGRVTWRLKRST